MKRVLIFLFAALIGQIGYAQTGTRNDAGLQGDAGATSGFFETVNPVNYPTGAFNWWHLLDVRHSTPSNNFAMQFSGSFFDQQLYFRKTANLATRGWNRVLQEIDGKVGIGTLSPAYDLDLTRQLRVGAQGGSDVTLIGGGSGIGSYLKLFYANGDENTNLKGNGDSYLNAYYGSLGIGTISPAAKLHIAQSSGTLFKATGVNGYIIFDNVASGENYFSANHSHHFQIAGVDKLVMNTAGDVGIGTAAPTEKLTVNGKIKTKEINVQPVGWADYVFEKDYKNLSLPEIEAYIQKNKHLPEIPSAKEVEKDGIALGEMNKLLLKKVEELTLHLIQLNKEVQELKQNAQKK